MTVDAWMGIYEKLIKNYASLAVKPIAADECLKR